MPKISENQVMETRQVLELFERIWPLAYVMRIDTSIDIHDIPDGAMMRYAYGDGVHLTLEFSLSRTDAAREGFADKRGIGTGRDSAGEGF